MKTTSSSIGWVGTALVVAAGCGPAPGVESHTTDVDGSSEGSAATPGAASSGDTGAGPETAGADDPASGSITGEASTDWTGSTGASGADARVTDTEGPTSDAHASDSGETTADSSGDSGETTAGDPLHCVDVDLGEALGSGVVNASVAGMGDDVALPCSPIVGEDHVTTFTAPYRGVFTFEIDDDDDEQIAAMVLDGACHGQVLACAESYYTWSSSYVTWFPPRPLTVALDQDQTVLVVATKPSADSFELGISGSEAVADDSCIDEDLGQAVGEAVAVANESAIYRFTAPHNGTYRIGPSNAADVFVPGCAATIETHLASIDVGLTGSPGSPDPGRAFDLVAGQEVAIAVSVPAGGTVELDVIPNASSGGTCCSPRTLGVGCDDEDIQTCVCEVDGFCCGTNWDGNCSGRAIHFCDASCIE